MNILANGYLVITGNVAFDFFFSWVGFFTVISWTFSIAKSLISKMK